MTAALRDDSSRCASDITIADATSLWELFKTTAIWQGQTLLTPVLVFDQFEEVFTFLDARQRVALADELGYLLSGNMP